MTVTLHQAKTEKNFSQQCNLLGGVGMGVGCGELGCAELGFNPQLLSLNTITSSRAISPI